MSQTDQTYVDDDAAELIDQWSRLPHPLEAAVLTEVNDPDAAVTRAAEIIHRRPPGVDGPTRSVWVLARCTPTGEGSRQQVANWCWYATRQAAEQADCAGANTVLHETAVPRAVRCDGVEAYLAKHYRARSAEPND